MPDIRNFFGGGKPKTPKDVAAAKPSKAVSPPVNERLESCLDGASPAEPQTESKRQRLRRNANATVDDSDEEMMEPEAPVSAATQEAKPSPLPNVRWWPGPSRRTRPRRAGGSPPGR